MTNEELYDKALEAIQELFRDATVSISETRANLKTLQDEIGLLLDSLDS